MALLDARTGSRVECRYCSAGVVERESRREEGEKTNGDGGVVEDLYFRRSGVFGVAFGELAAHGGVADGDCYSAGEDEAGMHDDVGTDAGEGTIYQGGVGGLVVFSGLWVNLGVTGEESAVRHFVIGEEEISIVLRGVSVFWAYVADDDARLWFVRLQVADLDHEGVWTHVCVSLRLDRRGRRWASGVVIVWKGGRHRGSGFVG